MHKRSVRLARHNTSISLEPEFWGELKRIAAAQGCSLNKLVARIDAGLVRRGSSGEATRKGNLSSALRVFVLKELKSKK